MTMKNTKQLPALILAALTAFAVTARAQDTGDDLASVNALLNDKTVKTDSTSFQKLSQATINVLAANPGDDLAPKLVNNALAYGTRLQATNRMLGLNWYTQVLHDIIDKRADPNLTPAGKGALAALAAAMAEGNMKLSPDLNSLTEWRGKLDALLADPTATAFVLDREKAFYNTLARNQNTASKKIADASLARLAKHDNTAISTWAKQEQQNADLRKTPFTLSVTTIDGKKFDTAAFKGKPHLYLYFWTGTGAKALENLKKLAEVYDGYSRKQLEVLAVCCSQESQRAELKAFIKKNRLPFPVYFDGQALKGDLCVKLGITKLPIGVYFDPQGIMGTTNPGIGELKKLVGK